MRRPKAPPITVRLPRRPRRWLAFAWVRVHVEIPACLRQPKLAPLPFDPVIPF